MREQEGELWIDYEAVKEEVGNMRRIIADLEANRESLIRAMASIGQNWQSSGAESFLQIAGEEAEGLALETERFLEIANWMDESADNIKAMLEAAKRRHMERN